jgi:tetratricopeptide (TPR) repeat protein
MDLMQSFFRGAGQRLKHAGLIGMPLFLLACASTPAKQAGAPDPAPIENEAEKTAVESESKQPEQYLPLSPELMYYILTAEVAGQRGQVGIAVDLYQRAAEMVESPALASRSAQVATLSRDQQRINEALERWIEVDPNDADVYIMQAPFLMMKDNYQGAVNAVNKALELAPDNKRTYLIRVSENLAEVAEPDEALTMLKQLDSYQQNDPAARFAYARMAFFYKRYEETLNKLAPLMEADPNNEDYLVLKADTLQRMGRSEEGLKLIARAAKRDTASQDLRFTYGKLLGENGETEEAREIFETILADDPDNRDALFALGLLALEDKDGQLAKSYFSELLKLGDPTYQAAYFMGLAEEMNGNIDAALVWFASVPAQSNRFDIAQSNYINLLVERGDVAKARVHLAQLRDELPQQALQYYLFEASILREQGQEQAAFDLLSDAITRYPQSEDLHYSRAMIAESLDKLDVLEADLRWILEKHPDNAQALNALGYTLTDRTDRHQEALEMITRALEIKPGDPFYLDSLGWVYYRMGDLEKAEKYLREAMNLQPDVEFIAHLGEVLWERGKKQEAKKIWQKGLQKDADNKLLQETMRRYGL